MEREKEKEKAKERERERESHMFARPATCKSLLAEIRLSSLPACANENSPEHRYQVIKRTHDIADVPEAAAADKSAGTNLTKVFTYLAS